MSDLGQDLESLNVKLMELQHSIDQSRLANSSILLDEARMNQKRTSYAESKAAIASQIAEHERNQVSIQEAIRQLELQAKQQVGLVNQKE